MGVIHQNIKGCFVFFSFDIWELVFKLLIYKEMSVSVRMKETEMS